MYYSVSERTLSRRSGRTNLLLFLLFSSSLSSADVMVIVLSLSAISRQTLSGLCRQTSDKLWGATLSAVCLQLPDKVCLLTADKLQTKLPSKFVCSMSAITRLSLSANTRQTADKFVRDLQTKSGQTLTAKCIDGSEVCLLMSNFVCFADIHRQSCFIKLGGPDKVGQCLSGHTLSAKCLQLPDNHYIRRQLIFFSFTH